MNNQKVVLAYSGGLDTSVMVKWLSEKYDADIITVTGILGATAELDGLEEKARPTSPKRGHPEGSQRGRHNPHQQGR